MQKKQRVFCGKNRVAELFEAIFELKTKLKEMLQNR